MCRRKNKISESVTYFKKKKKTDKDIHAFHLYAQLLSYSGLDKRSRTFTALVVLKFMFNSRQVTLYFLDDTVMKIAKRRPRILLWMLMLNTERRSLKAAASFKIKMEPYRTLKVYILRSSSLKIERYSRKSIYHDAKQ